MEEQDGPTRPIFEGPLPLSHSGLVALITEMKDKEKHWGNEGARAATYLYTNGDVWEHTHPYVCSLDDLELSLQGRICTLQLFGGEPAPLASIDP